MLETVIKNVPIATIKVNTSKIRLEKEAFLTSSRESFVESTIAEMENQYSRKFKQIYRQIDKFDEIDDAMYWTDIPTEGADPIIDLSISFGSKDLPISVGSEKEKESDLRRACREAVEEVEAEEDQIREMIFEKCLHGVIHLSSLDGTLNEESVLGIIAKEGRPNNDIKLEFIDFALEGQSIRFQKEFKQESKLFNGEDALIEYTAQSEDDEIKLRISFKFKELSYRWTPKDGILDDDHLVLLDHVS